MNAIDFANSYMTWFPSEQQPASGTPSVDQQNIARIQLDAACTLCDERLGTSETFYLIAPCRSERMYVDGPLFLMPNYEFAGVWGQDDFQLIRTHWISLRDNREYGMNHVRWSHVRLDVRRFAQARLLEGPGQIVEATLANLPLIARTEVWNAERTERAILEYPIKTMNLTQNPPRFQVDTGPLLLPDFGSGAAHAVERFEVAHVVYNALTKAEFILRRPTPISPGDAQSAATTDYSSISVMPARHEIFCGVLG